MNTLTGYSKSTLTDNYVLSAAGGHLPLVAGRLWKSLTSVTIEEANVVWYIKVEIPGYSRPSSMLILGSYNNIIDLGLVDFSGFSRGYIYRNIQQNGGNVTAVCMSKVYDSTTKKWTFWIKMRPINNSSGESPTLSATYKIYFSESYTITATATTTDPGVAWQSTTTNLVIKNADLIGLATKSTNITGGAKGSIPYQSDADTTAMLGIGSKGQVLKVSNSGLPEWSSDINTDTKVTQTVTTSNANYPLLLAPSGQTATTTGQSYFDSEVTLNPSTNLLDKAKVYESLLLWGGYNVSADVSPIDAAMSSEFAQNRLAFLNPDLITVEFTRDDGANWYTYPKQYTDAGTENAVTTGYEFITNAQKQKLVTDGLYHTLWLGSRRGNQTSSDKLRITILGDGVGLFIKCKKILFNYCQAYGNGSYCLVEAAMANAPDTFNTVKLYNISGWTNWNSIPYVGSLGEWPSDSRAAYTRKLRLTFGVTGVTENSTTDIYINKLRMFGTDSFAGGNSLTLTGHLYSFDVNRNATFPANLTSTGSLTVNQNLIVNGNTTLGNAVTDTITIKGKTTIEAGAGLVLKGNSSQNPLITRSIKGSDGAGNVGDLYIQYGANKLIYLGNTGAHTISADGSLYSGTAAAATKATQDGNGRVIANTYLPLTGGTLSGAITFSNISPITWNSGSYHQRINVTDDADANTNVFTFLQSDNTGSTWSDLFSIKDNGSVVATKYIKVGGTSVQFLKADGSVDSNTYATTTQLGNYLPLSGGTTTGLITLGASSCEDTIKWANSDFNSATAKAFMGDKGDWIVRVTYVKDLLGNAITATNFDLRYNRNTLKIGSHWALTSGNWSSHINLSTYATQAYVNSAIADAQLAGSNVVIPVTDVWVKTSGDFATVVSEKVARIDLSAFATTENLEDYLPLSGGTMTGVITTATGNSKGLKFGTSHLTSVNNLLVWQSSEAIRFGSSDLDWNSRAGLKYDHSNKTIYLGLADNTVFNANSAQSGGKVKFPGVSEVYVNRLVISSTKASVNHLQFSRDSYNYISAPSGGTIVILPDGVGASSSAGMTFTSSGFYPLTNVGYNLGTSSRMWNDVYGKYGKFQTELHSPNIYLKTPSASTAFGLIYVGTEGTTTTVGSSYIKIGNNVAEGANKNSRGYLVIYGTKAGANQILSRVTSSSTVNYYLPTVEAYSVYATSAAAVGGASNPVYVDANGKVNACTYSLNKTVPSDAVFTDTKNTAGSTNSTSKMYLIGATSQAANPQTYSDSNIYATDGTLTTSGVGKDGYMAYPKDGYYSSPNISETGYLCITLPLSWTDTMIKFDVNIFNYLNHTSVTYTISGYMYSPTQQWYNVAAYAVGHHLGGLSNLPVIFGHNGTKCVVYIGTSTTTWAYPKIAISNITLGWSNTTTEKWSTGWSFSFTTALGTYNANVQNTNVGYLSQLLQGKSAADFTGKYSWECTVSKNAWSRLCHVKYAVSNAGTSYILNVQEHRTSVVYNYTYLVNTHHNKKGHITLLNNSDFAYTGDSEARLVVDTYGNSYFEFRDGIRLGDTWTSATVICELIPISTGDITKYTTYTSGSSIPSDYVVAATVLHTGEGIPNVDNYWKNVYSYNQKKILIEPTSDLTFHSANVREVSLVETTFGSLTPGMTINLSFSGLLLAHAITSGYSSMDGMGYHDASNLLTYVYYVYVDGAFVGSYLQGLLFSTLVVSSGTSMQVTIKAKLNKSFTTNAWWHCLGPGDYYINSTSIGIQSKGQINITAIANGTGNVLRNSEYVSYKNGFVFSDIDSNSLTYCDKNQVIVKRGSMCLKFNSSGLAQSSNSGLTWSPITGMVTPSEI